MFVYTLILPWLFACAGSKEDSAKTIACGPSGTSQEECVIDSCAIDCLSIEASIDCCIETHGFGLEGDNLQRLLDDCTGDDCDPHLYISAEAALCVAQVHGLESGVGWCGGWFQSGSPANWMVSNRTYDGCAVGDPEMASITGDGIQIDARTGTKIATYEQYMSSICP